VAPASQPVPRPDIKLIIKNPAPTGPNQRKWGDYHFGRCLSKYLRRLGAEVETHYQPEWAHPNEADAVLVLRGKYQYRPAPGTINILWCMSNPSTISPGECDGYDAVCVASARHAAQLRLETAVPVHELLQCTDLEEFERPAETADRQGYVFVGNSRGVRRPCLEWAVELGIDLRIYGRGWSDWNLQDHVVADYVANEELPALYAASRLTFNDHWHDMKALGYVNNRIFDSLASALPVLSDDFPELRAVCGDALLYYQDRRSFERALKEAETDYSTVASRQRQLWTDIRKRYSFEQRAGFLLDLARGPRARRAPAPHEERAREAVGALERARLDRIERVRRTSPAAAGYCVVCGESTSSPLVAECPACGALASDRTLILYIATDLWPRLPTGLKQLLHVRPDRHIARLLHECSDINYLSAGFDTMSGMVRLDLSAIEFPDGRFDLIIWSAPPGAELDGPDAMRELRRVMKPGARIVLPHASHLADRMEESGFDALLRQPAVDANLSAYLGLDRSLVVLEGRARGISR
jgi:SAM-dependent methyltransferase